MNKNSFIFYQSFHEAISTLPDKEQLQLYRAITEYSLNQQEPLLEGIAKTMWILIKPQLDASRRHYEDGKKGGRPKKETSDIKRENPDIEDPETPDNKNSKGGFSENKNPAFQNSKTNKNVNDNENVNDNDNNFGSRPKINQNPVKGFETPGKILVDGASTTPPKPNGITQEWQDKAFRYADSLDIKLKNEDKSRWFKVFKQAHEGRNKTNLEKAYSYLVDYPNQLEYKAKIDYFFWIFEHGITPAPN